MSTWTDPSFTEVLSLMAAAFADTVERVESLTDSQLQLPTPCPDWNAETVAAHIVGALGMFADALGTPVGPKDSDPRRQVASSAAAVLAGWSRDEHHRGTITLPFGDFPPLLAAQINVLETFVHGVDLAAATGHMGVVDADRCDAVREMADAAGFDAFRQAGMFGPQVPPVEPNGVARLMAYCGRSL